MSLFDFEVRESSLVPKGECWVIKRPRCVLVRDTEDRAALMTLEPGRLLCRVFDLDQEPAAQPEGLA